MKIILRQIVFFAWFITVLSMWIPNRFKNRFMKENEILITRSLSIVSLVLLLYYLFGINKKISLFI